MQAEPQVVREGWLVKAPSPNNTWRFWDTHWKTRYFVLCSGHLPGESRLMWFQDEHHRRNGRAKGTINLQNCEQVDSSLSLSYERKNKPVSYKWIFDIRLNTTKGVLVYYFSAANEQDMNEWVRVLCHVCHLEREDDSDTSNTNERFSIAGAAAAAEIRERDGSVSVSPTERYVEHPPCPAAAPSSSWVTGQVIQNHQNGRMASQNLPTLPTRIAVQPSQLNVVPPAPFVPRPAAPAPTERAAEDAAGAEKEGKNSAAAVPKYTLGYIPLSQCVSDPTVVSDDSQQARNRLDATSDHDAVSPLTDPVITDQPPNFPAPPLPVEDNVFQHNSNAAAAVKNHHSRSASKDSSVSSVHLSSTESEQGENRRPSMGKGNGNGNGSDLGNSYTGVEGTPSGPTSPTSPPAAISSHQRVPRPSNSSSANFISDDASGTPPPRPPKTRVSSSSQHRQPYENEPTPGHIEEGSKFTSYDQITFAQRQVNFDSLPRTTKQIGRRSRDSPSTSVLQKQVFTNSEKNLVNDTLETAISGSSTPQPDDPNTMLPARSIQDFHMYESRLRTNSSSSVLTDDMDLSYSPFTPGPPRLAPVPVHTRPSRSPGTGVDTSNGGGPNDQYQNFIHPPRAPGTPQRSPVTGSNSLEKPPEIKRELKPRSPASTGSGSSGSSRSGIGPLPNLPTRLPDARKWPSGRNNGSAGNGKHTQGSSDAKPDGPSPQFNVDRQVSFKSKSNVVRQQTTSTSGSGTSGVGRNGILDTEVKVEQETQLEYIVVDTPSGRTANSPPETPASSLAPHPNPADGMSQSPSSSFFHASSFTERHVSVKTEMVPAPGTGYVLIDQQKTDAFRRAQEQSVAQRDAQHRTLERDKSLQQEIHTSGTRAGKKKR